MPRYRMAVAVVGALFLLFAQLLPAAWAKRASLPALCKRLAGGVVGVISTSLPAEALWKPLPPPGMGSGFVMDGNGHVITVSEVISDIHNVEVILENGHRWPTKVLGCDEVTGLVVLEIRAPSRELKGLRPLMMGPARSLSPGQEAVAIANPFGTGYCVAAGVISSVRPALLTPGGNTVGRVIQTDIQVPKAWCGGPLVDLSGRVIGVNTRLFTPGDTVQGTGFALSADTVSWIASQIISTGRVKRPWMGVTLQSVTPALSMLLGLPVEHGAMVTGIADKGPGAAAGLRAASRRICIGNQICPMGGDIIVAVDGKRVATDADVLALLRHKSPGDTVLLTVYREDRKRQVLVTLAEQPPGK